MEQKELERVRTAAREGDPRAQYDLGCIYDYGFGVERDPAVAARWYRAAAEQGHVDAQHNLAILHFHGEGVPRDKAAAREWMLKAAERPGGYRRMAFALIWRLGIGLLLLIGIVLAAVWR